MSNEITLRENRSLSQEMSGAAHLPADLVLLKMENESIMAVARTAQRNPKEIVRQLEELIEAYPAAADEAIYTKPVGTTIEITCPGCGIKYEVARLENDTICPSCDTPAFQKGAPQTRKKKKFAEGLSIRAAESIRSVYGYTRLAITEELLEDGKVRLTGVLVDYAAGNMTSDQRIISPLYTTRTGKLQKIPEDRFFNVVVKAEKAKLRRDLILDSVPNIIKATFRDACEKKLAALVAPEVVEQKIMPAFAEFGIMPEHLDLIVGRPHRLGWKEEERIGLRKLLTALRNGETSPQEILDGLIQEKKPEVPIKQQVVMEDLLGGEAKQKAGKQKVEKDKITQKE